MLDPPQARNAFTPVAVALARVALVVFPAIAAYWNSFDVPLQFDDVRCIVNNGAVHATELTAGQLARAAEGFPLGRWLAYLTFAANHAVHGLRPFGYHALNLAVHLGASLLVLAVAREIFRALHLLDDSGREAAATLAAVLFAVHPVNTQAVTYVTQRMTSLGAFFALLGIWLWLRSRGAAGRPRLALAGGAALATVLAVGCKENYAVVPLLLLVLEWTLDPELGARVRARWRGWAAAAAVAIAAGAWLAASYAPTIVREHARLGIPISERLLSQGRVLFHYLSLLALPLPARLHADYAWVRSTGILDPPSTLPGIAGVVGLAALAVWARSRAPIVTVAVGWFLVALLVEQTVLPVDLVFEHRLYFASVGLVILAAATLVRWIRVPRLGVWPVAVPLVAALALGTAARNEVWRDPIRRLLDPAAVGPGFARALFGAGAQLRQQERFDEAERVLRRALEIEPGNPAAYVNLGNVEMDRGRPEVAERWYRGALARTGPNPEIFYNLGRALERQRRADEARQAYETTLTLAPNHTDARVNLALILDGVGAGDGAAALALLDEAIRRDPGSVTALANRALLHSRAGRHERALADALSAARLAPDSAGVLGALARVHAAAGHVEAARDAARGALAIDPSNEDAAATIVGLPEGRP